MSADNLPATTMTDAEIVATVVEATQAWVEKAVIGLGLCPFAGPVQRAGGIRYVVSEARTTDALVAELTRELHALRDVSQAECETTLLIVPWILGDFLAYNEFLDVADATVDSLDLDGEIQIASFHPNYQFADAGIDDIENYTNRSPYPILHLLRESSVSLAVDSLPDPADIYRRNIVTLRRLGRDGWQQLFARHS